MAAHLAFIQPGQLITNDELYAMLDDDDPDTLFVFERPGDQLSNKAEYLGFRFNHRTRLVSERVA